MDISSRANETYKNLLALTTAKGLKQQGRFILSGAKLIREYLAGPGLPLDCEVIRPGQSPVTDSAAIINLSSALFRDLDVLGTDFNLLIVRQPVIETLSAADLKRPGPARFDMAIPLGDPGNLGALIRSCEAFGIGRAILTVEAAHPFLPRAVKASAGSVMRVSLARGPALRDFPATCIALDPLGVSLRDFVWPDRGILLIGEEGPGLDAARFTHRVRIPTTGVESLNAVVAGSIVLSHLPNFSVETNS